MKKLITPLLLILLALPSYADWTHVGDTEWYDTYINFNKITKKDNLVYYHKLNNFFDDAPLDKSKYGESMKSYIEADCKLRGYRDLIHTSYTEKMGKGFAISRKQENTGWIYQPVGTIGADIINQVCNY